MVLIRPNNWLTETRVPFEYVRIVLSFGASLNRNPAVKHWIWLVALTAASSFELSAADIASTFNVDASLTFTSDGITWTFTNAPFTADKASIGPGADGIYSGVAAQTQRSTIF